MHFTSEQQLDGDILERTFTLGQSPGTLWTPTSVAGPVPLLLIGHPGGLERMRPRVLGRARSAVAQGFAAATLELPGSGERPRIADVDQARLDLRQAMPDGAPLDGIIDRLIHPLVEQSVPEWQAAIDALLELPGIRGPVGMSGGLMAVALRLALADPRIAAVGLFAGNFVPRDIVEEARQLTVPVHMLLQWDDEGNNRQAALDLFDALGSPQKTLLASTGGHTGVPQSASEDAGRFFARHLR